MTSQGSAYGRFARALQRGNVFHAELAARELGALNLADALKLTILAAEAGDNRWPKMAARWHSRFVDEPPGIRHKPSPPSSPLRPGRCARRAALRAGGPLTLRELAKHGRA
jgi:hypothetical protein